VYWYFTKSSPLPTYFAVPDQSLFSECFPILLYYWANKMMMMMMMMNIDLNSLSKFAIARHLPGFASFKRNFQTYYFPVPFLRSAPCHLFP